MAIELYSKATLDTLLAAKLADAPSDGTTYGRKDGAWFAIVSGAAVWGSITGTVTDQTDLTSYITGLGYLTDAPSDGTIYGRKDAAWTAIPAAPTLLKTKVNMYASSASFDGTYLRVYLGPQDVAYNFNSSSRWFATVYYSVMYPVLSVSYQTDSSGRPYAQISCNGAGGAIDSGSPLYYTEDGGTTWTVADLPIL